MAVSRTVVMTRIRMGGEGWAVNREEELIDFPPLKKGGGLIREEGLVEDLRYRKLFLWDFLCFTSS